MTLLADLLAARARIDRPETGKRCRICEEIKPRDEFYAKKRALDGLRTECRECDLRAARQWRATHRDRCLQLVQRSHRTFGGRLARAFTSIRERAEGRNTKSIHVYAGLYVCPRDQFIEWAQNDPTYIRLHHEWVASGYMRKLAPSIDRIDVLRGYEIGNMQWLTLSENISKGRTTDRLRRASYAMCLRGLA